MRKELIARLQKVADTLSLAGLAVTPDLLRQAADMLEADAQPAVPQEHDLHNAIMNIQATPDKTAGVNFQLAYKMGHRDARHAAAELALASSQQRPRLTDAEILNIHALPCWVRMQFADKGYGIALDTATVVDFARAIEKKVRGEA